jgi:GR25 family glycosyltransferase involved in LPS biosynthesis
MDFNSIQNTYPTFIIHVPELAPDRTDYVLENVKNAGYKNVNVFKGVNGTKVEEVDEALKLFNYPKFDRCCSKGNIGCNLSMLKVFLTVVTNKIPIATIFEDDVLFHPDWDIIAKQYFKNTPNNFDIIYMGNKIDECLYPNNISRINKKSCFCMHAIIVTYKGAQKMLNLILNWNYKSESATKCMGREADGITNCDIILKFYQDKIIRGEINKNTLNWYCWNGTRDTCEYNKLPLDTERRSRNTGIVFQNTELKLTH